MTVSVAVANCRLSLVADRGPAVGLIVRRGKVDCRTSYFLLQPRFRRCGFAADSSYGLVPMRMDTHQEYDHRQMSRNRMSNGAGSNRGEAGKGPPAGTQDALGRSRRCSGCTGRSPSWSAAGSEYGPIFSHPPRPRRERRSWSRSPSAAKQVLTGRPRALPRGRHQRHLPDVVGNHSILRPRRRGAPAPPRASCCRSSAGTPSRYAELIARDRPRAGSPPGSRAPSWTCSPRWRRSPSRR